MTDKIEISKDLDDVTTAVTAITATEAGIAELVNRYDKVIFPVDTSNGMVDAKKARAEIRAPRFTIEKLRKEAKAPVLALGRSIEKVAADLTAQIRQIEDPVVAQIDAEEKRVADAAQKLIDDENKRCDEIRARITELYDSVQAIIISDRTSADVEKCLAAYGEIIIDESYAEFRADALKTWSSGQERLNTHLDNTVAAEAAAVKAAEDAEELAELRREKEKREAEEAAETKRKADINAELDRKAAAVKPVEEQLDSVGITGIEAEAVKEAITGDNLSFGTKPETIEETVVADDAKYPGEEYPGDDAIISVLRAYYGVSEEVVLDWFEIIRQ